MLHPPEDACGGTHCYSHGEDEPDDPCYRACGECYHVFPTAQALLDDHNSERLAWHEEYCMLGSCPVRAPWPHPRTPACPPAGTFEPDVDAEQVFSCPHCSHDW